MPCSVCSPPGCVNESAASAKNPTVRLPTSIRNWLRVTALKGGPYSRAGKTISTCSEVVGVSTAAIQDTRDECLFMSCWSEQTKSSSSFNQGAEQLQC